MEILARIILSHFFIRGKPQSRYRDTRTGRFVAGVMYRTTFGIKQMPVNHKYYGVTFYVWTNEPLESNDVEVAYDEFCMQLTNYLWYPPSEWWFSIFESRNWEMQIVPEVIDRWRFKVDRRGVTLYEREGDY